MAKQLLPNGSVVTLKGATKKLMTIGIEVEMEGDEKYFLKEIFFFLILFLRELKVKEKELSIFQIFFFLLRENGR